MKLLYVIGSMEVGGAEQHLLRVASGLRARGYLPEVFALSGGGPLTGEFIKNDIPVHTIRLPGWLPCVLRHKRILAWVGLVASTAGLWWLYWRRRADVVHFFLPSAYIVGGLAALFGPRMLRVMSRRSLNHYQTNHRLFTRLEYCLHQHMDQICGNSRAVVQDLVREGVPTERIFLIYNGIDVDKFRPIKSRADTRVELRIAKGALVFVMVANLIPYKGHADLIEALARIAGHLPGDWVCLCVGRDDGIGAAIMAQADERGIGRHIRLLGSRQDVPDVLGAADIGVLCSHQEGFSNAVIEGMACGLPMVVTDVGGNGEAVIDGTTGLVVPPHNPWALSEALLALARDGQTRDSMGNEGRRWVEEEFSMHACIDRYVMLYNCSLAPVGVNARNKGEMSESR